MRSAIVAGGCGLIGKAIVNRLANHGWEVLVVDPKSKESIDLYKPDCGLGEEWYKYSAFVNAAYPKEFETHVKFYMNMTERFCDQFLLLGRFFSSFSIVNLASIYGVMGPDDRIYKGTDMNMPSWYAAAKGAIIAHSRCMAVRYAPGIRINCVSPGGVFDNQPDEFVDRYMAKTPMGRMAMPGDIAGVVAFLLSDDAAYITGQNIIVDGGLTARV